MKDSTTPESTVGRPCADEVLRDACESLLARDHVELIRKFCAYRDALDYCLAVLKHHHMTKPGISTLVQKTEKIKRNANKADGITA